MKILVSTEHEADLFIGRHFYTAKNKPEIKEYFLFIWNDSNLQNAKYLTLHKFN